VLRKRVENIGIVMMNGGKKWKLRYLNINTLNVKKTS
jgi:hypothetical protein